MAMIAATGSASASAYAGAETDGVPFGDVFHPGSIARAELYIWIGSLAWLVFIGAAVQGL